MRLMNLCNIWCCLVINKRKTSTPADGAVLNLARMSGAPEMYIMDGKRRSAKEIPYAENSKDNASKTIL